ncbi:U3 small nucleolar RNA-associated protein 11 [Lepidopterella palustris CBS 459.81]|uniref:U3 small nucleolar RNA-associated protein 11 n=1 Tax=Lepidopterella palustris CBS 459.81 TaxID=1314670 RepID=A0A8E2JEE8_9PEZI|nr:U3 small nucleolar RNA-associated protein 11 [Lepidopterella palustris CBS 459.81]
MSSMRNAVQRRNHKERSQPEERAKWGILEKHKDYSLRAKDFNEKKKRLRQLRQKALDRNEDEFSFSMLSTESNRGLKIGRPGNKPLSMDVVKLLKTQDVGYVRTMLQVERKKRRRLEEEVVLQDNERKVKKGRHMVFVGDKDEQKGFRADEWVGTWDADSLDKVRSWPRKDESVMEEMHDLDEVTLSNKARREQETELLAQREERVLKKRRARAQQGRVAYLAGVKARERELMIAELELEKQRARMHGTAGGVNKNGVRFKVRERKR